MSNSSYHHGDLRTELIQKGIALLSREGYDGFSLRRLAAMCHVSHAAPYRHFRNKDELILSIASEIASRLKNTFLDAVADNAGDSRAQLLELGERYIRFMVENPDYFRYIFMTDHGRPIVFMQDSILHGENAPISIVEACVKSYCGGGDGNNREWVSVLLALWSQIQGLTLLLVNHTILFKGDYLAFAHKMLSNFLDTAKPKEY